MARLILLLLALTGTALADAEISVYSPRADAVSVTIYRDGLALITETRSVELPADAVTLVFENVVDQLIPQSAVVAGADRPLAESNFAYDRLTAASLVQRSVGKIVTLVRTYPKTGKVTRTQATIVSAGEGVVLQAVDGNEAFKCSGLPERLEFSEVPGELTAQPRLSIRLAAGNPGKRSVKLSYLSHGFSWQSNYVGRLNERADRMALTGWATLTNETNVSFKDAQVQLVAGTLNLLDAEEGGSRFDRNDYDSEDNEPGINTFDRKASEEAANIENELGLLQSCFPIPVPPPPPELTDRMFRRSAVPSADGESILFQSVTMTAMKIQREEFADYQLYRLPWATDLDARQTKQAVFLEKPRVKVERFYSLKLLDIDEVPREGPEQAPALMLRWENKTAAGLGEPLPKGRMRIFEPYAGDEVFAGEADIEDKAVGLPVELAIARALNVNVESEQEDRDKEESSAAKRITVTNAFHFANGKAVPIRVEVRHAVSSYWSRARVLESNLRAGRKYGDFAWHFKVAPGADQLLRYTLTATETH